MNVNEINAHLKVNRYGDFELTDAVRPSLGLTIVPREGYRRERLRVAETPMSVIAASVSAEHLFDVFLDLLAPLGGVVDVVLESSHDLDGGEHVDFHREVIDAPVLLSNLCDYEDLLLNDGCTGIAVVSERRGIEVQFDEHKLLIVYAKRLKPFARVLRRHGIVRDNSIQLITEAEHLHSTEDRHRESFDDLCRVIGVEKSVEWANG